MDPKAPSGSQDTAELRAQEMSRYRIAHNDADPKLRLLAQLAVKAAGSDIGGVSLVYHSHVAVVTGAGVAPQRIDRGASICGHAVDVQEAFFEIPDLLASPQFSSQQFPEMRHYAAATLFTRRGYVLGTLWTMAGVPGGLDESQRLLLQGLARLVVDTLELHYCDPATGMHNRAALIQQTQEIVASPTGSEILVGYINLACFHQINEIFGREAGDRFLSMLAQRLQSWASESELVGHFGADRFGFTLPGQISCERLSALQETIDAPVVSPEGRSHTLCARIGLVRELLPTQQNAGALFDMAETASGMIGAVHGTSAMREYTDALRDRSRMLQALVQLLDGCPGGGELRVYYQAQVNFADDRLIGFESLVRWTHPELGQVPTQTFVALAESSGHAYELDMRIAGLVCERMRSWKDAGLLEVPISLNLSRASLVDPRLPQEIAKLLSEHLVPGNMLEIEITEGHLLEAPRALHNAIDALRALGLRIAIDDFGIGYSNLDAIASLHFDRLKVDRRFVHGVADSETTASLFLLIQGVAQVSGAELLCEGLEREIDLEWLRRHGAFCVQGWYFGSAQPAEHAERLLRCWQGRAGEPAASTHLVH